MEAWSPDIDPTFRKGQCEFMILPAPHGNVLNTTDIHDLGASQKEQLFRSSLPTQRSQKTKGVAILQRLEYLDPDIAAQFKLKPDLIDGMTMRLVNGESSDPSQTYTALSYCWPEQNISDSTSPKMELDEHMRGIPLSPLLFTYLQRQRYTADEGIWCDQLCIDQNNKFEKSQTIGAMDAIYACARVVVVALEDISVTIPEQNFLSSFIKEYEDPKRVLLPPPFFQESPPFMESNPILRDFFYKICKARWFTRAWCSHEMRMAKRHKFVLRCSAPGGTEEDQVLVFSDFFLGYLCQLSSRLITPEEIKDTQITIKRVFDLNVYMEQLRIAVGKQPAHEKNEDEVSPYTAQIMEVFKLGAGGDPSLEAGERERDANMDRMTILLNSMGNGLALRREIAARTFHTQSAERCMYQLLITSLAADDPTSLCTLGKPFNFSTQATESSSWLRAPHFADIGSGAERQEPLSPMSHPRIKIDESPLAEWIQLPLFFLGEPENPPEEYVSTATLLIQKLVSLGFGGGFGGVLGMGPRFESWRAEVDHSADSNQSFTILVAAILWCGLKWMLGLARKCGFADPSIFKELRSTMASYFSEGFQLENLRNLEWITSQQGKEAGNGILRVAHWMKSWFMLSLDRQERDVWKPMLFSRGFKQKVLIFAPVDALTVAVIPTALLQEGYGRLSRVWILQVTGDLWMEGVYGEGRRSRNFLRGKSILFGNVGGEECEELRGGEFCSEGTRVFGQL